MLCVYESIAQGEYSDPIEMEEAGENEMEEVWKNEMDYVWDEWFADNQDQLWNDLINDLKIVKDYYSVMQVRKRKIQKIKAKL